MRIIIARVLYTIRKYILSTVKRSMVCLVIRALSDLWSKTESIFFSPNEIVGKK